MKKLGIKNIKEEAPGLILNYQNENYDDDFFDDWDEDSYDEDYEEEGNDNDEEKEMAEWLSVAKNFSLLISASYLLELLSMLFILPFYKLNTKIKELLIISMFLTIILMVPLLIKIDCMYNIYSI